MATIPEISRSPCPASTRAAKTLCTARIPSTPEPCRSTVAARITAAVTDRVLNPSRESCTNCCRVAVMVRDPEPGIIRVVETVLVPAMVRVLVPVIPSTNTIRFCLPPETVRVPEPVRDRIPSTTFLAVMDRMPDPVKFTDAVCVPLISTLRVPDPVSVTGANRVRVTETVNVLVPARDRDALVLPEMDSARVPVPVNV